MAAKRGSCVNCGRDKDLWTFEMLLPTFGLCWVCYEARKNVEKAGGSGAEVAEALQDVKEKVAGGKGLRGELKKGKKKVEGGRLKAEGKENQKPRYIEGEPSETMNQKIGWPSAWVEEAMMPPGQVAYKIPEPELFGMIFIEFKSAVDKALFDHIVESARVYRRTPDQQMLWMVQEYTRKEKPELLKEISRGIR